MKLIDGLYQKVKEGKLSKNEAIDKLNASKNNLLKPEFEKEQLNILLARV